MKMKDITGKRYGKLTVIKHLGLFKNLHWWECKCDCGNIMKSTVGRLNFKLAVSCGCGQREAARRICKERSRHNMKNTRIYNIWHSIKQRCFYKKSISFPSYGGRGITMCNEWLDFINFKDWALSSGYADNLSIDRKEVNGNYEPSNCRWFTSIQQANNRRNSNPITFNGKTLSLKEWSRIYNIKTPTLKNRLNNNWPLKKVFLLPVNHANKVCSL